MQCANQNRKNQNKKNITLPKMKPQQQKKARIILKGEMSLQKSYKLNIVASDCFGHSKHKKLETIW